MRQHKYKVKYGRVSRPNVIFFGLFEESLDWVKWKISEQDKTGDEIQFLMSYYDYSDKECKPVIKEVNLNEIEDKNLMISNIMED